MIQAKPNADTASAGVPVGSALLKEAERWMGAQGDLLTNIETMVTEWVRRQRQAFEASSRSVQRMCDARNIFDLLQAQNEWVSDCLHWTAAEIRAVGNDTTTITRKAAERFGEPTERPQQFMPPPVTAPNMALERVAAE
jgi:predicted lipoprotein